MWNLPNKPASFDLPFVVFLYIFKAVTGTAERKELGFLPRFSQTVNKSVLLYAFLFSNFL